MWWLTVSKKEAIHSNSLDLQSTFSKSFNLPVSLTWIYWYAHFTDWDYWGIATWHITETRGLGGQCSFILVQEPNAPADTMPAVVLFLVTVWGPNEHGGSPEPWWRPWQGLPGAQAWVCKARGPEEAWMKIQDWLRSLLRVLAAESLHGAHSQSEDRLRGGQCSKMLTLPRKP